MPGYFFKQKKSETFLSLLFFFFFISIHKSKSQIIITRIEKLLKIRHAQCPCRTNVCRCTALITTTANVRKITRKRGRKKSEINKHQRFIKQFLLLSICIEFFPLLHIREARERNMCKICFGGFRFVAGMCMRMLITHDDGGRAASAAKKSSGNFSHLRA